MTTAPKPFASTERYRANLRKLADYLARLPDDYEQFNMGLYMSSSDVPGTIRSEPCDTVACALGHGPTAGIRTYNDANWDDYSDRAFGDTGGRGATLAWSWCFSPGWVRTDNTPRGAAARIYYLLDKGGAPDGYCFSASKWLPRYAPYLPAESLSA